MSLAILYRIAFADKVQKDVIPGGVFRFARVGRRKQLRGLAVHKILWEKSKGMGNKYNL